MTPPVTSLRLPLAGVSFRERAASYGLKWRNQHLFVFVCVCVESNSCNYEPNVGRLIVRWQRKSYFLDQKMSDLHVRWKWLYLLS